MHMPTTCRTVSISHKLQPSLLHQNLDRVHGLSLNQNRPCHLRWMEFTMESKASNLVCCDCYVCVLDCTSLGCDDNVTRVWCTYGERVSLVGGIVEVNCHGVAFVHSDLARRVDVVRTKVRWCAKA